MAYVCLYSCTAKSHNNRTVPLTIAIALLLFASILMQAAAEQPNAAVNAGSAYKSLPMVFEPNQDQANPKVRFLARGDGYLLLIGDAETDLVFRRWNGCTAESVKSIACAAPEVLRMQLMGAHGGAEIVAGGADSEVHGEDPLTGTVNYLIGNDPRKWKRGLPTYGKVRVAGAYPGVDLIYYGNQRQLEYDFVVAPGANPDGIRLRLTAARMRVERDGDLIVSTKSGPIVFRKPFLFQEIDGVRRPVGGGFRLHGNSAIGFRVGNYDHSHPLVIDPILSYSTIFTGATIGAIAVDPAGNAYITGVAVGIPTTAGAFQSTDLAQNYGGNAFVTKLNSTGTGLVYSTYLGGTGGVSPGGPPPGGAGDGGSAIAVDGAGNAYLAGFTYSLNFPTKNPLQAQNPGGNDNAFVTELDSTGSGLVYSTYLGGSGCGLGSGDQATGIALDSAGAAYVVGTTCSRDFPVTAGAFQPTIQTTASLGGWGNGFVSKISAGGTVLEYSTYLAGPDTIVSSGGIVIDYQSPTQANAVAVDSGGNAYVTGGTFSDKFPVTAGAFQTSKPILGAPSGAPTAFVAKFNPTGTALAYATYLGGTNGSDSGNGIAVDSGGNAYVTGSAGSTDFPVTPGAYQTTNKSASGLWNVFVTKLNPSGSALAYSTYLGGSGSTGHADPNNPDITNLGDSASGIAIDSAGNAYIAGAAGSTDFPVTTNAVQAVNHAAASGNTNAFVAELNPAGTALLYATYLGGSGIEPYTQVDYATGLALNGSGKIYLAGVANSTDFPTTAGAYETTGAGSFASMLDLGTPAAIKLSIAPASLNLTTPAVGHESVAKTVTLASGGTSAVTIQSITIGGTNAAEFAQTNTCGGSLSAGDTCTISVTFIPAVAGSESATLSISDDAPGSPQTIPLTGDEIFYPHFSPTILNFGNSAGPQTATFLNYEKGPLDITSISWDHAGPFAQTNDCGSTLLGGASCTFQVTFTPTGPGEFTDSILVSENQDNSPQVLQLTGGTATFPGLNPFPTSLTFGPEEVGSRSSAQAVTVSNSGGRVTITSIAITGDFSETDNCVGLIAVSGSCTISVSFNPTAAGLRTGTVTITSTGTSQLPQTITISGTGTMSAVTLSAASLTFSPRAVGSTSAAQLVQLTSSGQGVLSITSIAASGDFAVSSTCGSTLSVSSSCAISVTFTPTMAGSRAGKVTITDDASGSPQMITLTGNGTAPAVMLSSVALQFAAQDIGLTSTAQTVTLMNSGEASLIITGITASGDFAQTNTCGTNLVAGKSCTISITFTPTAVGSRVGAITIMDNASSSTQTVNLLGTGRKRRRHHHHERKCERQQSERESERDRGFDWRGCNLAERDH